MKLLTCLFIFAVHLCLQHVLPAHVISPLFPRFCSTTSRFTKDLSFARRVFPLFEGLANFWECILVKHQGRLHDDTDCAEELCSPDGLNQGAKWVRLRMVVAV